MARISRRGTGLLLFITLLLVAGCDIGGLFSEDERPPPVRFSIAPLPARDSGSHDEWLAAYRLGQDLRISVAHTYMHWRSLEPAPGVYDWSDLDYQLELASDHGMQVSLTLLIVDVIQLGMLPADLESRRLDDPELRARFLAFVEALAHVARDRVSYLWLGNEVDMYLHRNPEQLAAWTELFRQAVHIVHREAPRLKVGLVVTYHDALKSGRLLWIHEWGPYCDLVAVTFYPEMMPAGYEPGRIQSQFDDLVQAYGIYPLALVETAVGAVPHYGGGEEAQVIYCGELFRALARHRSEFLFAGWFNLHDLSPEYLARIEQTYSDPAFVEWIGSLGLARFDGTRRPVMERWAQEVAVF